MSTFASGLFFHKYKSRELDFMFQSLLNGSMVGVVYIVVYTKCTKITIYAITIN